MIDHIPLSECKHGFLYRIRSRNLTLGVYNETIKGFIGIRLKFGHEYLDTEFHWETGPPFGTASPIDCLEECSLELKENNKELFQWLKGKE